MTIALFDSSAVVKLLIDEDCTTAVQNLWAECDRVVLSRLALVEVQSALSASHRAHRVDERDIVRLTARWRELFDETDRVAVDEIVLRAATELVQLHPLSGADAVHLASALALANAEVMFATFDRRLHAAAVAEGLSVFPAELAA